MTTCAKASIFKPKLYNVFKPTCDLSLEPNHVSTVLANPRWKEAILLEYDALVRNGPWSLVYVTSDTHVISNKWVCKVKHKAYGNVERYKARIVAKGFQQTARLDYFETLSPLVKAITIRVIFTLIVTYN